MKHDMPTLDIKHTGKQNIVKGRYSVTLRCPSARFTGLSPNYTISLSILRAFPTANFFSVYSTLAHPIWHKHAQETLFDFLFHRCRGSF